MIDDEMDRYISRSIKNWAALKSLPAGGRERLLQQASQTSIRQLPWWEKISISLGLFYQTKSERFHGGNRRVIPATQSRVYSYYLITNWRFAS